MNGGLQELWPLLSAVGLTVSMSAISLDVGMIVLWIIDLHSCSATIFLAGWDYALEGA